MKIVPLNFFFYTRKKKHENMKTQKIDAKTPKSVLKTQCIIAPSCCMDFFFLSTYMYCKRLDVVGDKVTETRRNKHLLFTTVLTSEVDMRQNTKNDNVILGRTSCSMIICIFNSIN